MAEEVRASEGDRMREYAQRVFGMLNGAVMSAFVYLGDELGLFRALADVKSVTSDELAERTGLSERWVREWLRGLGAARILEYLGDGHFALSPEGAAILADEGLGRFGLRPSQQLPMNAFVSRKTLTTMLRSPGRVNAVFVAGNQQAEMPPP